MSSRLFIGCSDGIIFDTFQNGGWLGVLYPNKKTKTFAYYSNS